MQVVSGGGEADSLDIGIELAEGGVVLQQVRGLLDTTCTAQKHINSQGYSTGVDNPRLQLLVVTKLSCGESLIMAKQPILRLVSRLF